MRDILPKRTLSFILYFVRPYGLHCLILGIVGILWAIDLSLHPYLMKMMIDILAGHASGESIYSALALPVGLYIGLGFFMNVVYRVGDYISLRFFPKLTEDVSLQTISYVQRHAHSFFQNQFGGSIVSKVSELATAIQEVTDACINKFFSHTVALMIACYTMSIVHSHLAIILVVWGVIFLTGSYYFSKKTHALSIIASEAKTSLVGKIMDSIGSMLTVRLFAREKFELSLVKRQAEKRTEKYRDLRWGNLKLQIFMATSADVLTALLLLYLVYAWRKSTITLGDFALILSLSGAVINSLWNIAHDFLNVSEDLGIASQTISLVVQSHEIRDTEDAFPLHVSKGEISYDNVVFGYNRRDPLFKNLCTTIEGTEKVGLVGGSGSGKTTFVNLITRLYDLNGGRILIDGQDIKHVTQESLHEGISFIAQDPSLFHRTIHDNIAYGRLDASREDVINAAIQADAHNFISELPQGYDTMVGERGVKLSGGQRQRIAMARAFLKDAKILILDEATSALDSLTEHAIQKSLKTLMKGKTVLAIAHRLSTLNAMDRIIVFDHGRIVEDGTHRSLVQARGLYAHLWDMQRTIQTKGHFLMNDDEKVERA